MDSSGFREQLAALKRRGCAVMVVGDGRRQARTCRQLLGEPGRRRRHLLVATSVSAAEILARRPEAPRVPDRLGVVDAGTTRRGTAGPSSGLSDVDLPADWCSRVDSPTDVEALAREVGRHSRRLAWPDDEPGTFRCCLDSLDPLVDGVGPGGCFRFVHLLAGLARSTRGMTHVHVGAGVGEGTRAVLGPLFDATVRVRSGRGHAAHQRWTVHETGTESDWLPVADGPV